MLVIKRFLMTMLCLPLLAYAADIEISDEMQAMVEATLQNKASVSGSMQKRLYLMQAHVKSQEWKDQQSDMSRKIGLLLNNGDDQDDDNNSANKAG